MRGRMSRICLGYIFLRHAYEHGGISSKPFHTKMWSKKCGENIIRCPANSIHYSAWAFTKTQPSTLKTKMTATVTWPSVTWRKNGSSNELIVWRHNIGVHRSNARFNFHFLNCKTGNFVQGSNSAVKYKIVTSWIRVTKWWRHKDIHVDTLTRVRQL